MTIRHVNAWTVDCDGCGDNYGDLQWDELDAVEAVNNAEGWRTDDSDPDHTRHWCPACQQVLHTCASDANDPWSCARCGAPVEGKDGAE